MTNALGWGDRSSALDGEQLSMGRPSGILGEVLVGLHHSPKTLPPKLFYDAKGAALFEAITQLDEYYLTGAEHAILSSKADEMAELVGSNSIIVEPGSGNGQKVRPLLNALRTRNSEGVAYLPVDVAEEQLASLTQALVHEYPEIRVTSAVADFSAPSTFAAIESLLHSSVGNPATVPGSSRRVIFFPGSTIGNFHPSEAGTLLRRMRDFCGPLGALIVGADLRKDPAVLHAAYNDAQGVTAAFNMNILHRINRECSADFDTAQFRHYAFYNPLAHRIEMHLVSLAEQYVRVSEREIVFARGESIWTESSYKYDRPSMDALLAGGGWRARACWEDPQRRFGVWYCESAA